MRAALERAADEANKQGVPFVGTEHVLLALMDDPATVAGRVLADLASPEELRSRVRTTLGNVVRDRFLDRMSTSLQRCDEAARTAIDQAQEESRLLDDNHVGTEHLLLALLRLEGYSAAALLARFGVTRASVLDVLHDEPGPSPEVFIPWTGRALRILELAAEASSDHIEPEHLLAGIMNESDEWRVSGRDGPHHLAAALSARGSSFSDVRRALDEGYGSKRGKRIRG